MNENELCVKFIQEAEHLGFTVFPEYEKWDILLTRNNRSLIGVQAKLKLNFKVISQCLLAGGVHFKVILTTGYKWKWHDEKLVVLSGLRILLIDYDEDKDSFIVYPNQNANGLLRFRHRPKRLLNIPNFNYSVPAGVQSPRKVSERNINLVRLENLAKKQGGWITLADARSLGFNRVPQIYYFYAPEVKKWRLRPEKWRASKDYPHIAAGIQAAEKSVSIQ